MKEIALFTSVRTVDDTIRRLGALGVVDIQEVQQPGNGTLEIRREAVEQAEEAVSILAAFPNVSDTEVKRKRFLEKDPKKLVERIRATSEIRQKCEERIAELHEQLRWYQLWGEDVRLKDISYLKSQGIHIRLYLLSKAMVATIDEQHTLATLPMQDGKIPTVLFSRDASEKLAHKEVHLPPLPLAVIKQRLARKERQLEQVTHFLEDQREKLEWLTDYVTLLSNRFGMQKTLEGMGDIEGKVKYLKGYIPKEEVVQFEVAAKEAKWGYQITDPANPEEVPVYIKNPKWIRIINPVMKFIDIVPGYKEVDVSIYFLIAFALFFALLVGDAGYGAIFLIAAIIFRKKMPADMRILVFVLSGATMVWGVLSGTYFGAAAIAALPFLRDLVIQDIASFGVDNISFMMHLTFIIGAIHLTIAHSIRVFQFINSVKALSEIGWIALVWGLFFVTEQLVLGNPMPSWGIWLFIGGAALVALFSMESKSFLGSMGVSLANLPLSLISGFSDIVSYVRLFAVGMATAAVASSFNNMILPDGIAGMGFINIVLACIALLLGHGLNIALALMAVMVHGIRLNMLEFAGHLGVQFTGEAYKPFVLISPKNGFEQKEHD